MCFLILILMSEYGRCERCKEGGEEGAKLVRKREGRYTTAPTPTPIPTKATINSSPSSNKYSSTNSLSSSITVVDASGS